MENNCGKTTNKEIVILDRILRIHYLNKNIIVTEVSMKNNTKGNIYLRKRHIILLILALFC